MSIYVIQQYNPHLPLFGEVVYEALQEFEQALKQGITATKGGGRIFFIHGSGGLGKSQLLNQINLLVREQAASMVKNYNVSKPGRLPLFSGVIDLYDYTQASGRGLEVTLRNRWEKFFNDYYSRLPPPVRSISRNFKDYDEEYNNFRKFRNAMPNVTQVETIINNRRKQLDQNFEDSLAGLTNSYLPIICLDTAEYLEEESQDSHEPDAARWLYRLLGLPLAQQCIFIIAGRTKNESGQEVRLIDPESTEISSEISPAQPSPSEIEPTFLSIEQYLKKAWFSNRFEETSGKTTFLTWALKGFNEAEIKSYIYWYDRYCYKYNQAELPLIESREPEEFAAEAEENWPSVVNDLISFPTELRKDPAVVYERIYKLTEGKPLLVDWFCRLVFGGIFSGKGEGGRFPGLTPHGEVSQEDFLRTMAKIIVMEEPVPIHWFDHSDLNYTARDALINASILRYACIARKGLDVDTVAVLSEMDSLVDKISREEAKEAFKRLLKNPFIKVRREIDPEGTELFFLHDEVYNNLFRYIKQDLNQYDELIRELVKAYHTRPDYLRAVVRLESLIDLQRHSDLELGEDEFSGVQGRYWYDQEPKVAGDNDPILRYIELNSRLQDCMVEALSYRLQHDFLRGYDEYAIWVAIALVEQEQGMDTRLKKEFLREYRRYRKLLENNLDPDFVVYYELESELQNLKRLFRDKPVSLRQSEVLLRSWKAKVIQATKKGISNELEKRLLLCQADALVSIYDYVNVLDPAISQQAFNDLSEAIRLLDLVKESLPKGYQIGQPRSYVFWQKHVLMGRAYYHFARLRRLYYDYDGTIVTLRIGIEHFKQAKFGTTFYLTEVRNSLAYAYNERGAQGLALELCDLVLQEQLRLGRSVFIGLTKNVLSQILVSSNRMMLEAYTTSQQALRDLTRYFQGSELKQLRQYWLLRRYNAEMARRVARNYAEANLKELEELYKRSIDNLLEIINFYEEGKLKITELDYLECCNNLGSTYRSRGRTWHWHIDYLRRWSRAEPDENKRKELEKQHAQMLKARRDDFEQAQVWFDKAIHACEKDRELYWYWEIDTQQDLAQLATYRFFFEEEEYRILEGDIKEAFDKGDRLLEELRKKLSLPEGQQLRLSSFNQQWQKKELSLEEIQQRGKALSYALLMGRNQMHYADWAWKRYRHSGEQEEAQVIKYVTHQINALEWFHEYQPEYFIEGQGDYSQTLRYVNWVAEDINNTLKDYKEREIAARVLRTYIDEAKDSNTKKKKLSRRTLSPGVQIFLYMVDLGEEVGLSLDPWRRKR